MEKGKTGLGSGMQLSLSGSSSNQIVFWNHKFIDMNIKGTFPILFFFCWTFTSAQQATQYSLYMFNEFNFNPAYAGLDHSLSLTGGIRSQWVGLEGSPSSQFGSIHMPLYFLNGAVGLQLENDELGPERNLQASAAYSYQTYIGSGILSLGVGAGIFQKELDGSLLRTPDGQYEANTTINHQDAVLPEGLVSGTVPTFRAGVYYQNESFEAGLAVTNLSEGSAELGPLSVVLKRNFFFNAAVHLDIGRNLTLHPSVFVKSDAVQTQTDLSAILQYNENLMVGGTFRGYNTNSIDAAALLAGFKLSENITLIYAYDISVSDLSSFNSGSHEIVIGYNLNKRIGGGRPPRIIYNPRNL